jgi:hypothetical protein
VLVDLVGLEVDTQERIAQNGGNVQIGTHRHANPEYYDLLKARVGAEQVLANISSQSVEANAQAEQKQGDALSRLLVGGALAHNKALTPADSGGILIGAMGSLFGADAEKQKSEAYQSQLAQAQSAVNDLSQRVSSMSEYSEEPIYQEFHTEDRYVVKKAVATAYVKAVDPQVVDNVYFTRKIVTDITVADTLEEANPAIGKKGHALDLPSDQQMKRDVSSKLTKELVQQVNEGFLSRIGLEYYANAILAERRGEADRFAENAIRFLLSPAAKAYPSQAGEVRLLLGGVIQRAARSVNHVRITELIPD